MSQSTSRRAGVSNAFWSAAAVTTPWTSNAVHLPQWANSVIVYIDSSGAATYKVQVAHSGNVTSEGILPTSGTAPSAWFDLSWLGTAASITFAGAAAKAFIIPNLASKWIRLVGTADATITAGWEAQGN